MLKAKKTVNSLVKNIIRILINHNNERKKRKYTKKQTKITTYNNKLGPGLITYTPSYTKWQ